MKKLIPFLFIFLIALAACGSNGTEEAVAPEATGELESTPAEEGGVLPPEPQEVTFLASDGQALSGYYYPAAVSPAPLVVLMHWVGGNMSDWYEIAPWLQNRRLDNPFDNPGTETWWDPSWFPAVPAEASYGVFIFSFRDCAPYDAGCAGMTPEAWLLDAQAAMETAWELEGVDPTKVVAIGSSIGADGAADGCAWLNEQHPGACQGALSLSPGGYLGVPYHEVVGALGGTEPATAAWCLADEVEVGICEGVDAASNTAFKIYTIPGGSHGTWMLKPDLDPLPLQLILDFLAETTAP